MSGGLALLRAFCQWKTEDQLSTVFFRFHSFFVTIFIKMTCMSLTPGCTVLSYYRVGICISARFKVNCEVMPLRSFSNF